MIRKKLIFWLLAAVFLLTLSGRALAQVSTSFDLSWHALTGGGGSRNSASVLVQDSLGQWGAGVTSGNTVIVQGGFWNTDSVYLHNYLPLILR